jgi:hypothetical protein
VKEKRIKITEASRKYAIPVVTIRNKIAKKHSGKVGASTLLSSDEENKIIQWIIKNSSRGFPVTRSDVLDVATQISRSKGGSGNEKLIDNVLNKINYF